MQLPDKPVFVPPAVATADPPPPVNQLLQTLNHRFVEIAANGPLMRTTIFLLENFLLEATIFFRLLLLSRDQEKLKFKTVLTLAKLQFEPYHHSGDAARRPN